MNIRNLSKIIIVMFLPANILYSTDKNIIIYDPLYNHGINFYNTLKSIYPDSTHVIFNLDTTICDSDALFIFLNNDTNEYILNEAEGNLLITYMTQENHVYIFLKIASQNIKDVSFWNYIGIQFCAALPTVTHIDSIVGVPGTFTEGLVIPNEFNIGHLPHIGSGCFSILDGFGSPFGFPMAYAFKADSGYAVIDLFNEIFIQSFLEHVLIYFDIVPSSFIWKGLSVPIDNFVIFQNFPNPFNSSTTIRFSIHKKSNIKISITNLLGQHIDDLLNRDLNPGNYRVRWNAEGYATGVYFYTLFIDGKQVDSKKLLLTK